MGQTRQEEEDKWRRIKEMDFRVCFVQFCPVRDTVKAMVDANSPISSQQRAAEETALLGLFRDLYSLTAALRVVALLEDTPSMTKHKYEDMRNTGTLPDTESTLYPIEPHNSFSTFLCAYQLLVNFCFDVSGEG